jgi:hypothetical protein
MATAYGVVAVGGELGELFEIARDAGGSSRPNSQPGELPLNLTSINASRAPDACRQP